MAPGLIWEREPDAFITKMWEDIWDNAKKTILCNKTTVWQILNRTHDAANYICKYTQKGCCWMLGILQTTP